MTLDLAIKFIYIGMKAIMYAALAICLIISLCAFVHFIVTRGWSDEVKTPRKWKKSDKAMAEKWGSEWEKLQKIKAKRNGNRL